MRVRFVKALAILAASATVAGAQGGGAPASSSCTGVSADACQQAIDFFQYMAPQLGTAITGGNTTLAQGGSLGGMRFGIVPRIAIGVRVNAVQGNVPNFEPNPQLPGATAPPAARELTSESQFIPGPAVDVALGLFKGVPLALSNVGGVDLLLSAAYVPKVDEDDFKVTPDKSLEFGYGVRIGLLQESLVVPGVGFSYMIRKFPTTTLEAIDATASATVRDLALESKAWRLTLSKSLLLFGLSGGVGQDTYDMSTTISAAVTAGPTITTPKLESSVKRTNYFGEVSMNLLLIKLVGSVGMASGGDIKTYNSYDTAADKSRLYGSVGVRFGI
jgi:hypothetical protein